MTSRRAAFGIIKASTSFALSACIALVALPTYAGVSQTPLLLGAGTVPGNLALVPSVEYPTVISRANLGNFDINATYAGYFDSEKCYQYQEEAFTHVAFGYIDGPNGGGYFYPTNVSRNCTGKWSGNYLNWAATQTIDPFRKALTGGYRSVDTRTTTILEKATRENRGESYADVTVSGSSTISQVTPYNSNSITASVKSASTNRNVSDAIKTYQKNKTVKITAGKTTEYFSVRVKVCVPGLLEPNCVQYGNNYKPEGLIQRYAGDIRYSAFSYLNIDGTAKDGGVLRSAQKYVGPQKRTPGQAGEQSNDAVEWNTTTGQFITNPDNDSIGNSGVINYINKFGELTNELKSNDPVSELYYTALRYFKEQGNLSAYSNTSNNIQKDLFPVVTNWSDPLQYACQKNVILGIGDVNTHWDRDLPVGSDTLNVNAYTQKVFDLEGINKSANSEFTGRNNSAYIAGLAYYANTTDIRPDTAGKQTISTYWVDVRENESLAAKNNNQYWLAAKYGGFKVPDDYGLALERATALPTSWWRTTTDNLATNYPRPDNFYVASDANNMVAGLTQAFAQIANEVQSTTASLATNSTRLETDTALFQSRLDSRFWSGDLFARGISTDGEVAEDAAWSAATKLDALSNNATGSRKIFTITPDTSAGSSDELIATTGLDFTWSNGLKDSQKTLLKATSSESNTTTQNRLAYLRGDRTNEMTVDDRTLPFRERGGRLGDIINSDPQYLHQQDFGYSRLVWNDGAVGQAYKTFRASNAYQNRTPLVVVGANDGMLHGFDARVDITDPQKNGGSELFAYVPNSVIGNLKNLSDPAYTHQYYVDGTPRVSDVWLGNAWKSMVVGTTGAGGNSVFALDITDPANMSKSKVMWEFTHPDMGYTIGQPALVALPNEKFGVIVSSGYHDTTPSTDGKVWILDAADGSIIKEFTLPTRGNLGSPLAADTDYNQVADRVYVADTLGNVWRIDLADSNPSSWSIPSSLGSSPLFIAKDRNGDRQAITAPLSSAFNEKNEHMIFFGTGSFYKTGDNEIPTNPQIESFYGIIDKGIAINGRSNLLQQTIIAQQTLESGLNARAISDNALTNEKGWYLDFDWWATSGQTGTKGERVVAKATLRSGRVIVTSMTPSADPCAFGGDSWIMAIDLSSGSRLNYIYFDTDRDGDINDDDTYNVGNDDNDGNNIPWSSISDPSDGVVKGVAPLYKWLCYAGSNGAAPECIPVAASQRFGRHSWRELRKE
ncbi:pilus assembly protein [Pseudomonas sp.]|uniref:pilus assembly protein n=1 Tax=Pseudomonas sp. TaxID=306 RepID=UPI003A97246B